MRNFGVLVLVIGLGMLALTAMTTRAPMSVAGISEPAFQKDKPLPEVCMENVTGENYCLKDKQGKFLLINFWASWCPPCIHEFPDLLEFAEKHPEQVELVLISSDNNADKVVEFVQKLEPAALQRENVNVVWDQGYKLTRDTFGVQRLPETIWVSPDGIMQEKILGVINEETFKKWGAQMKGADAAQ